MTLTATKQQKQFIDRQPFAVQELVAFCGTKKLAKQLAVELGDALCEADRSREKGESDDTTFEMMFWDGIKFFGEDELFDLGIRSKDDISYFAMAKAYEEPMDATFFLCETRRKRKFILVVYEFNGLMSAWWLTRDDHLGK